MVLLVVAVPRVGAHDGQPEYIDEIDGYYVEVSDDVIPASGLMYTLLLRDLDPALPVDDAEVEIRARAGDVTFGPAATVRFANAYSVLIPDSGEEEWTVDVLVERPGRSATAFSHPLVGIGGAEGRSWWASLPALVAVWTLPVVLYLIYYRRVLRPRRISQIVERH